MFLELSSTNHMNFVQIADFDWLQGQLKRLIFEKKKNIKKSSSEKP